MENKDAIEAIYSAEGYMEAAKQLKEKIIKNPINFFCFSSAMTVNLSFSIEIYLKQLQKLYLGDYKSVHGLKKLYDSLPRDIRNIMSMMYEKVISDYINIYNENYKHESIEQCLKTYNDSFVTWRYSFEEKNRNKSLSVGWVELFALAHVLRDFILTKTSIQFD